MECAEKGREGGGREEQKRGIRAMRQGGGRGGGAKPRGDERSASHLFLTGVSDLEGTRGAAVCPVPPDRRPLMALQQKSYGKLLDISYYSHHCGLSHWLWA